MDQKLKGRRIAALAADGFEKVELLIPMKALKAAGAEVDVISLRSLRTAIGLGAIAAMFMATKLRRGNA